MEHYCRLCGTILSSTVGKNRKYCDECRIVMRRNNANKRYHAKHDKYTTISNPNDPDQKYCEDCFYKEAHTWNFLCNYYLMTGIRRGCPAGVGCNKKKKG